MGGPDQNRESSDRSAILRLPERYSTCNLIMQYRNAVSKWRPALLALMGALSSGTCQ